MYSLNTGYRNVWLKYDPGMSFLGIYPKNSKSTYHRDTYTPMFIATFFIITRKWKQPTCLSAGKQMKKNMASIQHVSLYHEKEKYNHDNYRKMDET